MSLRWFLIIAAIGFIASLSNTRGNFLPQTQAGRIIAIILISILVLVGLLVAWALLPFASSR